MIIPIQYQEWSGICAFGASDSSPGHFLYQFWFSNYLILWM